MSRFFVGQRVRLVRPQKPSPGRMPVPVGDVGVITSLEYGEKGDPTIGGSVLVSDSDCQVQFKRGGHRSSHTDRLEPILPEGHAPSVYSFEELMDKCRSGVVA